jgi:hypothetical protein
MPKREKCKICNGNGRLYYPNGPDDFDEEVCEECQGIGQINIGFYPKALENNRNVWTNQEACFNCGASFDDTQKQVRTSCSKCSKSFIE